MIQTLSQIALGFVICLVVYRIDTSAFLNVLAKLRRANRQLAEKDRTIEGLLEENDNWKAECEQLRDSLADAESVNLAGVEHDLGLDGEAIHGEHCDCFQYAQSGATPVFMCHSCHRVVGWCLGAADNNPDLCDTCAAKADAKRHAVESIPYASPELCGEILGGK